MHTLTTANMHYARTYVRTRMERNAREERLETVSQTVLTLCFVGTAVLLRSLRVIFRAGYFLLRLPLMNGLISVLALLHTSPQHRNTGAGAFAELCQVSSDLQNSAKVPAPKHSLQSAFCIPIRTTRRMHSSSGNANGTLRNAWRRWKHSLFRRNAAVVFLITFLCYQLLLTTSARREVTKRVFAQENTQTNAAQRTPVPLWASAEPIEDRRKSSKEFEKRQVHNTSVSSPNDVEARQQSCPREDRPKYYIRHIKVSTFALLCCNGKSITRQ